MHSKFVLSVIRHAQYIFVTYKLLYIMPTSKIQDDKSIHLIVNC